MFRYYELLGGVYNYEIETGYGYRKKYSDT